MGGEGHRHTPPPQEVNGVRYRAARNVTLLGAAINALLALLKVIAGWLGHSQALIADGIHSLSDLASDAMVLFAAKHGAREADESHPYGHGRIETLATVALGGLLLVVAVGLAWDAGNRLFQPERLLKPGLLALGAAVLSVVSKELLYHYTMHVARKLRSPMLKANAWHHRSDAISSVVVIVGVAGTMAGLPYLDAIAAIGVALMVAKIGGELLWNAIRELIDTALEGERVEAIRRVILSVDGVRELHMLRTRKMGGDALVDVHLLVDPKLSVSEGHHISETVRQRVCEEVDEVADVLVHIDPEDDENVKPSLGLPLRGEVMMRLYDRWRDIAPASHIDKVMLHYLGGRLYVEVFLPQEVAGGETPQQLRQRLRERATDLDEIADIAVYYH